MCEDRNGALWFGKNQLANGLFYFNPNADQILQFKHDPYDANSLADDIVIDIICSADEKTLWVTTADGTLHRVDASSFEINRIQEGSYSDWPKGINISRLAQDGTIWLGGVSPEGELYLSSYNPNTEEVITYPLTQMGATSADQLLPGLTIDREGNIWLAAEKLIAKLDSERSVSIYPLPKTANNRIVAMISDDDDNLWLATSIGVSVFRPIDGSFYSYSTDFEIAALPFQLRAVDRMVTGELLMCGRGGCLMVNEATVANHHNQHMRPKTLAENQVLYTNFLVNGKEVENGPYAIGEILANHQVTLDNLDNNFSIELALLDFKHPELNHFDYMLEGYDTYWRKTGDKSTAYYSQVPPGSYLLRVKGYNAEGEYGEAIPIQIIILPPWWRTWWAIASYVCLLFAMIYGVYRFQLSRQLTKAETQRLQELDVAKTQLYTNITHEFRTPLTVILGMAKQLNGQLPNAQNLMVEMISRNGQNLLNLVNQMLDLSKLESGQMNVQLQQGDLIIYLKYLVESFHSYAETRRVTIHFLSDLETQIMDFDPKKIQQIISNVLSNAIKFTPSGGDIYLSVDVPATAQEELLIRIKDTGVGIEPERLPHIFERFYQADDSYTKEFAGTGIGLALVAELVKLMGGKISAKSELGKGTEIAIRLQITRNSKSSTDLSYFDRAMNQFYREGVAPQDKERINLRGTASDKPTILIIEDNYDVRTYISACLSDNFNLLTAENGQRGVEKAIEYTPDFIISDVMMPLKDGYTLVRELKSDKRTSHIPIILLTAKADANSKLIGLKQGADAYLAKPFNPEELIVRVNKLLELRQRLQQQLLHQSVSIENDADLDGEHLAQENQFVQQVNAIIYAHLDDINLDVKAICKQMNMSHSQLHRKLSALTGLSINRYIRHLRLERAKELLRKPGQTVTAVAYDTGYKDPSYFGRVFKQETGLTPAEWQRGG
ncbi:MAG: ATP-binding protein [Bacteroidota bacterium]